MLKKVIVVAGLAASLMANTAWAFNAKYCLRVTSPSGWGGKLALENTCRTDIEAAWCISRVGSSMCSRLDNSWTIHPGVEMPLDAKQGDTVIFDGCEGANTIDHNKSSLYSVGCK
jgi:hypothetical protein